MINTTAAFGQLQGFVEELKHVPTADSFPTLLQLKAKLNELRLLFQAILNELRRDLQLSCSKKKGTLPARPTTLHSLCSVLTRGLYLYKAILHQVEKHIPVLLSQEDQRVWFPECMLHAQYIETYVISACTSHTALVKNSLSLLVSFFVMICIV